MLVYLDHSHLVLLAEALARAPSEFASFMAFWRSKPFILALSRVHLVEMRRHADSVTREQRYQLLEQFAPVRSDIGPRSKYPTSVLELEIIAALHRKALEAYGKAATSVAINIFSEVFEDTMSFRAMRAFEAPIFDEFLRIFHAGVETGLEAQSRPRDEPYKPARASDLPREPISKEQGEQALAALEAALRSDATLSSLYGGANADVVRQVINPILDKVRDFIRRSQEIGVAAAYAESIGADVTALGRKRMDEIVQQSVFTDEVRRIATMLFKQFGPTVASPMAALVTMRDCPGYWLARQLDLEIRAAEPVQDASNAYDLDHVTYFPYVDLFLADKRIADYVRRVLQRSPGVVSMSARRGPHSTARSVTALRDALEANA